MYPIPYSDINLFKNISKKDISKEDKKILDSDIIRTIESKPRAMA